MRHHFKRQRRHREPECYGVVAASENSGGLWRLKSRRGGLGGYKRVGLRWVGVRV